MLEDKLKMWLLSLPDGEELQAANQQIDHLAKELYVEYEPTKGPERNFWQRFDSWVLNGQSDDEQMTLFKLAAQLFFIGTKELDNLYRVAFNANVTQWLIEQLGLELDDPALTDKISQALKRTWFCPLTDSMRINAFYHLNHLSGRDFRPDWFSLEGLGDPNKVSDFLDRGIDFLVLLEDFIGTGEQVTPAIDFAGTLRSKKPTLVVPLVICPEGIATARTWAYPHISVSPVLKLGPKNFVYATPRANENSNHTKFRQLANDTFALVLDGQSPQAAKVYSPFGLDHNGGSLVVLVTNCPDNTLPLVHHSSGTWKPLFPRASRL